MKGSVKDTTVYTKPFKTYIYAKTRKDETVVGGGSSYSRDNAQRKTGRAVASLVDRERTGTKSRDVDLDPATRV